MQYDEIYNCECRFTLNSGRELIADSFAQFRTYAGLLMGTPNKRSNDSQLMSIKQYVKGIPGSFDDPLIIPPLRNDYRIKPGDMQKVVDRQKSKGLFFKPHIPEWMPEVYCIATFISIRPARDTDMCLSGLTVVWFQDNFGINSKDMNCLLDIDWEKHATDFDY